jgi:hypothetical protein
MNEDSGLYILSVDSDSQKEIKKKVKEFRDHNILLQKKISEIEERFRPFESLNVDEVQEALKARQQVKESELLHRADVEKHIQQKIETERSRYEKEITEARETASMAKLQLDNMQIEKWITNALNRVGQLQKGALEDVLRRASLEIEVKEGEPVERSTGLRIDPMEWANSLMKECSYFFVPNSGIGSRGSNNKDIQKNPWLKDQLNLSEQGRIYKENPELAKQMAASAGVRL